VLDARQANVHWGAGGADAVAALKAKDKTQAVKILADRQKELAYQMPKRYEPVRQYATHHDVWDRSAGIKTTHQPIIDAMRYGAAAPAAVGLAGLASPGDTRAAKLNRDMTHQPVQVPAVAATVSDLMRDIFLDPAGYLGPLEPTTLGNGEQLPPGELARLLSGGGGGY
jgi:shikimate 5-dehydrogenase